MVSARLLFVAASAFAIQLAACGGNSDGTSLTRGSSSSSGGSSSGGSSSGGTSSGSVPPSTQSDGGGVAPSSDAGSTADTAPTTDLCTPYIGKWLATIDPGAVATGTDTDPLGGSIPFSGTIDFTFVHDDADLPNILDFSGTSTIKAAGQTITQPIVPAKSPTGDPKDSTCEAGVLHFLGEANVSGIGVVLFTVEGHLDTSVTPTVGLGTFTMNTKDDNGAALSGKGTLHMVRQ